MAKQEAKQEKGTSFLQRAHGFWVLLLCQVIIFGVLFHKSLWPQYVLFNNDNPIGNWAQPGLELPQAFTGIWVGLNWLGFGVGGLAPSLSSLALWGMGALYFAKLWQAISLIILGVSGWACLRSLKFSSVVCVLGGLAFSLHSDFFSNSCWGQVSRPLALSAVLLAMAALNGGVGIRYWLRALLAGLAVGWGIMEGLDIGALFSLIVGAYTLFQAWVLRDGALVKRVSAGAIRLCLVAGFSAFVAASIINTLMGGAVKGVQGMEDTAEAKQERWSYVTQWSLPKAETLGTLIPGLFGYRMDTPDGGNYWGLSGSDPAWDSYLKAGAEGPAPQGMARFTGNGYYSGVLVLVIGLWGLLQSFQKGSAIYSAQQKKFIWFWAVIALLGVLLAWGRYAPFYRLYYSLPLPFLSTIRNPVKFMHIADWALLMLFAYGLHGLSLRLVQTGPAVLRGMKDQWASWRGKATTFDKRWLLGSKIAVGATLLGWLIYASSSSQLQSYLVKVQFDPSLAASIARFSIQQVGWFVLFLILGLLAIALVLSGYFSGKRANWGAWILGILLVTDLARANLPWIVYMDFDHKYASNSVIEKLAEEGNNQRVAILPEWIPSVFQVNDQARGQEQYLNQLYRIEWAQHLFLYYGIRSIDVIQLPRPPVDFVAYEDALRVRSADTLWLAARRWELTSTRCILGLAGFADLLNAQIDPEEKRFHAADRFEILPKTGVFQPRQLEDLTARIIPNGPYAMIEFAGALPRAKLYSNWLVSTNDESTLNELASHSFDPQQTVLVSSEVPAPSASNAVGTVEFVVDEPKQIELETSSSGPSVLLLNDRFDPSWTVTVDDSPATLLRCNYLMRGVYLTPGKHKVEFKFSPPTRWLWVSVGAIGVGLIILVVVMITGRAECRLNNATANSETKS